MGHCGVSRFSHSKYSEGPPIDVPTKLNPVPRELVYAQAPCHLASAQRSTIPAAAAARGVWAAALGSSLEFRAERNI